MEDIPKIAREQLAAPPASEHPDANLLAAFGESSLLPRERVEIIRHLANCAACREIVMLSLPEEDRAMAAAVGFGSAAPQSAASLPIATATQSSFNMRWGALAVCAVIVAAIGLMGRHAQRKTASAVPTGVMSDAKRAEADKLGSSLTASNKEPSQLSYPKQQTAKSDQRKPGRDALADRASARVDQPVAEAKSVPADRAADAISPAAPPPAGLEKAEVSQAESRAQPASPNLPARARTGSAIAYSAPVPAHEQRETAEQKDKQFSRAGSAFAGSLGEASLAATHAQGLIRWTLSGGELRRSGDAGRNWAVVPVDPKASFRALSVLGADIWVGGKGGTLYHSSDDGAHWVHLIPSTAEGPLNEDVLRLEFSDGDHGKVITLHEEWLTANCGVTWERRPRL